MGEVASGITRGVCRLLSDMGFAPLVEFRLTSGRRVDVMGLGAGDRFLAVEVKSSVADFRADGKWPEYGPFCDWFYFAVGSDFPLDILPEDCGLMMADPWHGAVRRSAPQRKMNGNRRRKQLLRFATTAAGRLHEMTDPRL